MRYRLLFSVLMGVVLCSFVNAATDSKPGEDGDSPKAALRAQDAAAQSENVEQDLAFYQADGDQQKKLAEAMAAGDVAVAKLQKATEQKFGKELAAAAVRAAGSEDIAAVDAAAEKVDGDHAAVEFKDQSQPVPMVRVEGKWKISLADWVKGASAKEIDGLIKSIEKLAAEISHVTDLVSHDKFRSGEGVRDRVQELRDAIFR
jgi:hypothetical protein